MVTSIGVANPVYENESIARSMEAVTESGLNLSFLAEQMGVHKGALYLAKKTGVLPEHHTSVLRRKIKSIGIRLIKSANNGQINLEGLHANQIAKRIGVSNPVLCRFLNYPQLMPEPRRLELLAMQKDIGEMLIDIAKDRPL